MQKPQSTFQTHAPRVRQGSPRPSAQGTVTGENNSSLLTATYRSQLSSSLGSVSCIPDQRCRAPLILQASGKCLVTDPATWHPLSHCGPGMLTKKLFSSLVGNSRNLNGLVRLAKLEVRATCQRKERTANQQGTTFLISSLRLTLVASKGELHEAFGSYWEICWDFMGCTEGNCRTSSPEEREILE